eukprot:6646475-Alexandrium_andersonii.AAC.1
MMCYDRASEIQFLYANNRLDRKDVSDLQALHSDIFLANLRSTEGEMAKETRKKRRWYLKRAMSFKHGA